MTHQQLEFISPGEMGAEIDAAFTLATDAAKTEVMDAARGVLRRLLLASPTVHANDLWRAASAWCPPETLAAMIRHRYAVNSLWLAAKRQGWVVESGEWRTSNRRSSHRRSIVWRSCLYGTTSE
jgi:hypothetical protein